MQTIYIKRLGPISELKMDINKFNLLIGEQATGKSTISKCIYFFRIIKNEIVEHLYQIAIIGNNTNSSLPKALNTPVKDIFIQLFGYSWELDEGLHLTYCYTDSIYIEVKLNVGDKKYIGIYFSNELVTKMKQLEKHVTETYDYTSQLSATFTFTSSERVRIHQEITNKVNEIFQDDLETYYIPAGRSLLTLMTNQKTKLDYNTMDLVNRKFMQFIESIQSKFELGIREVHRFYPMDDRRFDVSRVSSEIVNNIKGDYRYQQGNEYLEIDQGKSRIPINFASSGQQEVLWLFNQLYILMLRKEKAFVIIEELEAHLYPTLQKEVLEFVTLFANINQSSVVITSHSPYVLTAANMLYCAGKLYEQGLYSEVDKIIGKNKLILPSMFNAQKLFLKEHQTQIEDLVDKANSEIKTELIDDVSRVINETYTELFYLEVENEEDESSQEV